MQVKTMIVTLGLGAAAGAAAILMMPKNSQAYQTICDAADTIKMEAGQLWHAEKLTPRHPCGTKNRPQG